LCNQQYESTAIVLFLCALMCVPDFVIDLMFKRREDMPIILSLFLDVQKRVCVFRRLEREEHSHVLCRKRCRFCGDVSDFEISHHEIANRQIIAKIDDDDVVIIIKVLRKV